MRVPRKTAEDLIRSTGERITAARVEILSLLLAAPRALAHREIEDGLDASLAIDRVTVYRVLEWLTDQNLAHKISADDRVWRFNAVPDAHERQHAHFHCTACGEVICLEDLAPDIRPRLPAGYAPQSLEVTIKGLCSVCGGARRRERKRAP
ncbi:MAG: transcriptional repressor [Burkholderiales bacterium]|nr:transcriptional repressor [Burkholderiales bacterium]